MILHIPTEKWNNQQFYMMTSRFRYWLLLKTFDFFFTPNIRWFVSYPSSRIEYFILMCVMILIIKLFIWSPDYTTSERDLQRNMYCVYYFVFISRNTVNIHLCAFMFGMIVLTFLAITHHWNWPRWIWNLKNICSNLH